MNDLSLQEEVYHISQIQEIQQRKIDERRSLLTEEYLENKYPEDSLYVPPSLNTPKDSDTTTKELNASINSQAQEC